MMRRYGAPSRDSSCLLLSKSMISTGQRKNAAASTAAMPTPR